MSITILSEILLLLASRHDSHPLKLILIDDDKDDQQLFMDALLELGLQVKLTVAFDGMNFLEQLKENNNLPDIIFLDLNMPGADGFEILHHLRMNDDKYKDVPIVIYTTSYSKRDIDITYNLGANLYLPKPSNFSLVVSMVGKVINTDWKQCPPMGSKERYIIKA